MKPPICLLHLLIAGLLLTAGRGHGGPVNGPSNSFDFRVPGGAPGQKTLQASFEGGKRACVIMHGDHDPVVNLGIEVFDEKNRLVAKDEGKGDFAAVIWYPPTTGTYTVRVSNPQPAFNKCYLVVK